MLPFYTWHVEISTSQCVALNGSFLNDFVHGLRLGDELSIQHADQGQDSMKCACSLPKLR